MSLNKNVSKEQIKMLLFQYFTEILENKSKYDYIIFVTRKSFDLLKVFLREHSVITSAKIFSSKAIDIIGNDFNDKKVLIVDDILIHGKALYSLKSKIEEHYHPSKIDLSVFIQKYDQYDAANTVFSLNCNNKYLSYESEWKRVTEYLVEIFHDENIPYTSYVADMDIKDVEKEDFLKIVNDFKAQKVEHKDFPFSFYISFNNADERIKNIVQFSVLRIYYNENLKKLTLSPYVQLDDLNSEEVAKTWDGLINKIVNLKQKCRFPSSIEIIRALTAAISIACWEDAINNSLLISGHKENLVYNYDELNYSFYDGFSDDLKDIIKNKEILYEFLNHLNSKRIYELRDNTYISILQNSEKWELNNISSENNFSRYIEYINDYKETQFETTLKTSIDTPIEEYLSFDYDGLPYSLLYSKFSNGNSGKEILSKYIELLELGHISADIQCYNSIVYTGIRAGERSWKLTIENNSDIFLPIAYIFRTCELFSKLNMFNENNRNCFFQKAIERLSSEFNFDAKKMWLLINTFKKNMPYSIDSITEYAYNYDQSVVYEEKIQDYVRKMIDDYIIKEE